MPSSSTASRLDVRHEPVRSVAWISAWAITVSRIYVGDQAHLLSDPAVDGPRRVPAGRLRRKSAPAIQRAGAAPPPAAMQTSWRSESPPDCRDASAGLRLAPLPFPGLGSKLPAMAEDSGVQVQAIAASAKAEVPTPGVAVWNWFSLDQAASAALFSRKCGELEDHPPAPGAEDLARGMSWSEATYREHRSLGTALSCRCAAPQLIRVDDRLTLASSSRSQRVTWLTTSFTQLTRFGSSVHIC